MSDWIVTLPMTVQWHDYERELAAVANWKAVLNYRIHYKPKAQKGDRCFIVWKYCVRGWMEIVGVEWYPGGFVCQTSGKIWKRGFYLQRSGPFHYVGGPEMKGFRGLRRYSP